MLERLGEIGDEVGGGLDTDRQTHQRGRNLERRPGCRSVGHLPRVLDQALDRAE